MTNDAATIALGERWRKVRGRVRLQRGDLRILAEETGRTRSHIYRLLSGERSSPELEAEIERLVGVPVSKIDLPRNSTNPKRPPGRKPASRRVA